MSNLENNRLKLLVSEASVESFARLNSGVIEKGVIVNLLNYNVNNLLCQLLDYYGEDEIIKKIKSL